MFARDLRLELAREHLGRDAGDTADLIDPVAAFTAFAAAARDLHHWTTNGRTGPRPAGQLRPYDAPALPKSTLLWATPLYRAIADPDGRPLPLRAKHRF